jgi:hypothetical protein
LGLVSAGYGAILLRRRRPVTARQTAARAMINHHSSAGLTTTTHATRCALCVVRTPPEPPGGCGLLSPCGRRSRRGVLGSGWGRLAARRAGGQRRRRRRGDFGLNSGIFSINNIGSRYCRFSYHTVVALFADLARFFFADLASFFVRRGALNLLRTKKLAKSAKKKTYLNLRTKLLVRTPSPPVRRHHQITASGRDP